MTVEDVAEAPSQTGADKSGNLGLMDLAAELSLEPEPEKLASEEESLEVTEEVDESGEAPEPDESETESEEDDDVLSQGEQEEEPEEESESEEEEPESKGVQKLLKQVSKLTARAKTAEEERDELREKLDELQTTAESGTITTGNTGVKEIDKATTPEEIDKIRQKALSAKRWAMEHLGKDYVEQGETTYDGDDIRRIFGTADAYLTEYIPQREQHLSQRFESDKLAKTDFPVWRGEEEEGLEVLKVLQKDKEFMEVPLGKQAAAKYYLGLMYEGMKVVNARKASNAKSGKVKPKKKAMPPKMASEGASVPAHDTTQSREMKKKAAILGDGNISSGQLASFFS